MDQTHALIQTEGGIPVNITVFRRHLRAENLSPNTDTAYTGAAEQVERDVLAQGMPCDEGIHCQQPLPWLAELRHVAASERPQSK